MASIKRIETNDVLKLFYQFIAAKQAIVYAMPLVEINENDIEQFFKKHYPEIKDHKTDIWNIIKIE